MDDPVYILIRTSARPKFFDVMMKSIKSQTYSNIITIVHTDDPEDNYLEGDIVIRSERNPALGNGHYNLYCNKLLNAIPDGPGWYHFIDDDDMYASDDVIENLVKHSKRKYINIGRVQRWGSTVWPKTWGTQRSYQTECFFLHTDHKHKAKWWNKKGGDHHYSKQLTDQLPINWIDNLLIAKAQDGKGRGYRLDMGEERVLRKRGRNDLVAVKFLKRVRTPKECRGDAGEIKSLRMCRAMDLESRGRVIILDEKKFLEGKVR